MPKVRTEQAECAACRHRWTAKFEDCGFDPILECPKCESMAGQVMVESIQDRQQQEAEDEIIRCWMCGNKVHRSGDLCSKCNLKGTI